MADSEGVTKSNSISSETLESQHGSSIVATAGDHSHSSSCGENAEKTPHVTSSETSRNDEILNADVSISESSESDSDETPDIRRSARVAKQSKIMALTLKVTQDVNTNSEHLDYLYSQFDHLDTIDKLESTLQEIENAALLVNQSFDELYLLCDNKVDKKMLSFFDNYMREVQMTKKLLQENLAQCQEAAERAEEEKKKVKQMEESLEIINAEWEKQMKIYDQSKQTRSKERERIRNKLRNQQATANHPREVTHIPAIVTKQAENRKGNNSGSPAHGLSLHVVDITATMFSSLVTVLIKGQQQGEEYSQQLPRFTTR